MQAMVVRMTVVLALFGGSWYKLCFYEFCLEKAVGGLCGEDLGCSLSQAIGLVNFLDWYHL